MPVISPTYLFTGLLAANARAESELWDRYRCYYWPRTGLVDPDRLPFVQLWARSAWRAAETARLVTGAHIESVRNLTPHGHP